MTNRLKLPWGCRFLLAYLAAITIIGKGPTYLGFPPFYWGEITLALSLALILPWARKSGVMPDHRLLNFTIAAFMGLGAVLTAISYPRWRLDALRDAAIWYYGFFYFVGLALAAREEIAGRFWEWLRIFWIVSLVWNTANLLTHGRLSFYGPVIPWRGVPLFFNSVHEAGEHLALGALIVLCTTTLFRKPLWRVLLVPIALLALGLFVIAQGRGMRIGIASGVLAVMLLGLARRRSHLQIRLLTLCVAAVPVLALASVVYADRLVTLAHLDRFEDADPIDPTGTANWRMVWWEYLYAAVMKNDPAFGLGFGESLSAYHPLLRRLQGDFVVRSPHNFNMTVFSRMGLAGVSLWALVLVIGIGGLFRRVWCGTARGQPYSVERLDELTFWILMLVTTVVNSSFGVLMEGPVLGIWFWFALGFASGRASTPGAVPARRQLKLRRPGVPASPRAVGAFR